MAKYGYTANITKDGDIYTVEFPDLGAGAKGKGFPEYEDTVNFASDMLAEIVIDYEKRGRDLPAPADPEAAAQTGAAEVTVATPTDPPASARDRSTVAAVPIFVDTDEYMRRVQTNARRAFHEEEMKEILSMIEYQCSNLYEGIYVSDSREMSFVMKNTTGYHFRSLSFDLVTYDEKRIRISVGDWRPKKTRKITFHHDFNRDWHYQTMNVIRFRTDTDSVEYELYSPASRAAGQGEGDRRNVVTSMSTRQGYLVAMRSFWENVDEYDLSAKARELEDITIDLFDIMNDKPEMSSRTRKFKVVYLPTVSRVMNDYQKAVSRNVGTGEVKELREKTHEALNLAIVAFAKLKEDLTQEDVLGSEVDLDIMKSFMKEEGLIK